MRQIGVPAGQSPSSQHGAHDPPCAGQQISSPQALTTLQKPSIQAASVQLSTCVHCVSDSQETSCAPAWSRRVVSAAPPITPAKRPFSAVRREVPLASERVKASNFRSSINPLPPSRFHMHTIVTIFTELFTSGNRACILPNVSLQGLVTLTRCYACLPRLLGGSRQTQRRPPIWRPSLKWLGGAIPEE